jgi:hypothetical protein
MNIVIVTATVLVSIIVTIENVRKRFHVDQDVKVMIFIRKNVVRFHFVIRIQMGHVNTQNIMVSSAKITGVVAQSIVIHP